MTLSENDASMESNENDLPKLLSMVTRAVKLSQELPSVNTPGFIYYNDFPQYKAITSGQSKKILMIIQKVLDALEARTNVLDLPNSKEPHERFSSIVDANDRLLERLAIAMDIEEDPSRKESLLTTASKDLLVVAVQDKQHKSLGWLANKSKTNSNGRTVQPDASNDGLLKLLSSRNICRPQTLFSEPPDNSAIPFRPKIKCKPNSIQPLTIYLSKCADDSDRIEYTHPYEAELEEFAQNLLNWEPLALKNFPVTPLESAYQFVDSVDLLDQALNEIAAHKEVAVDLEHHSYRSYLGITCLIQMSTRDVDYIFDALALRDHLYRLNEIFTNPAILKVFHGCDSDLMWLQRDFGVYVVNMFDTGLASRALQLGRYSLSFLLYRYAQVTTNKQYQLADWRIRPLTPELVEYARKDTHYLLHIASILCQELQDRDLLLAVLEQCRQLCLKIYTKPVFNPLGFLDLYKQSAGISFTHRQLYALEHLYALRDSIARREDESIHYVLPNHMLKVIAEVLPRETSGLFACCNPIPPLVRKYVYDLHKIVLDARNKPVSELPLASDLLGTESAQNGSVPLSGLEMPNTMTGRFPGQPHDRSHHSVPDVRTHSGSGNRTVARPSKLGQIFTNLKSRLVSRAQDSPIDNEFSRPKFMDADRMLLDKLLTLIAIQPMEILPSAQSESMTTDEIAVKEMPSYPTDTIIRISPEEDLQSPPMSSKPTPVTAPVSNHEGAPAGNDQQLDDDEEIVVLRDEVPSKRRHKRRRANASGADLTSPVFIHPGKEC
ncbi:unnamed protein product [Calicophoron daubneyi]|uniref:HRDC domain-containing protein n=1 Tax=Calicophoron daubneyi TaxID=300641 RepID=A0AAV2SYY9_CALDB